MAILRIATSKADLNAFGGSMSTDSRQYDNTRVAECYRLDDQETGTLQFPAHGGLETWLHWSWSQDAASGFNDATCVRILDDDADVVGFIRIDGSLLYFNAVGDSTFTANPVNISINSPFIYDMQFIVDPGVSLTVRAYINGSLQMDATVVNTQGRTNPTQIEFLNPYSGSFEHDKYFSEVIAASEDTRGFRLRELKPQAFGVFSQWDGTVDSVVDDSLATGISTDVADERTSFGVTNLDNIGAGDLINRVVAQSYGQRGASGLTAYNHFFRYDDGHIEDGSDITMSTFGDWYVDEYANNPRTAAPWTPADLAGIQIGVRSRT